MTFSLRHLHVISRSITIIGLLLLIAGFAVGTQPVLTLVGAMMIIAGVVKLGMMWIWTRLAHLGTEDHHPEEAI